MAKKPGQPTRYRTSYNEDARKLCLLGATDKQMADFFGVTEQTVNNWKQKHPRFFESIKEGKLKADAEVASSLFQRACGYEQPEDKIFCTDGRATIVPTIKHYPPDTAAAFIWLKNRAGWRDKTDITSGGEKLSPALVCPILTNKAAGADITPVVS